ncbi:trichodiene oxygenase, partial [Aspergillus udagawae]
MEDLYLGDAKGPNTIAHDVGIFRTIIHSKNIPATEKSIRRLTDDAKFLMKAGTGAPSQVMAITMFHVLQDNTITEKPKLELKAANPNPNIGLSLETLEQLPYLSAIIKEGIRISSIVISRLPRIAEESLKYQGWDIPPGTPVSMSTYIILRDSKIIPEPLAFRPERWTQQGGESLNRYPMPFSRGSQACLGPSMTYCWCYLVLGTILR